MSEAQFWTDLKKNSIKFFWSALLLQLILGVAWFIWTGAVMTNNVAKNTEDIKIIKNDLSQKASMNMVLQIKSDQNEKMKEILDNTKDLKSGQISLMNALIDHVTKKN